MRDRYVSKGLAWDNRVSGLHCFKAHSHNMQRVKGPCTTMCCCPTRRCADVILRKWHNHQDNLHISSARRSRGNNRPCQWACEVLNNIITSDCAASPKASRFMRHPPARRPCTPSLAEQSTNVRPNPNRCWPRTPRLRGRAPVRPQPRPVALRAELLGQRLGPRLEPQAPSLWAETRGRRQRKTSWGGRQSRPESQRSRS